MAPTLPPIIAKPPPLLTSSPDAFVPAGWVVDFPGMTLRELQAAIVSGARFVQFQFCFSVVILSFKRLSPIFYLPPGAKAERKGRAYSRISMLAGWWGFPWGPIWTLTTIANNISGGKDVTRHVIASLGLSLPVVAPPQYLSPVEAEERERAASRKNWMLRIGWGVAGSLLLCLAALVIVPLACFRLPDPGVQEYFNAQDALKRRGNTGDGNTRQARLFATRLSTMLTDEIATNSQPLFDVAAATNDELRAFCHCGTDKYAFVIHVPGLEQMSSEACQTLSDIAWTNALTVVQHSEAGLQLAIFLQGTNSTFLRTIRPGRAESGSGSKPVSDPAEAWKSIQPWFVSDKK